MKRLAIAVPGDIETPTGGYVYDHRMVAGLRRLDFDVAVIGLGDGFPWPEPATRAGARARLEAAPAGPIIIDGLAYGALPELAEDFCRKRDVIALVHHPLALETGLATDQAQALRTSERRALAGARHVIVTSDATARTLVADYAVPPDRISVVRPGNDPAAPAQGSRDGTLALLCVGTLVPRKGHDVLLAALAPLADRPWRLTIVGERRDPAAAAQIEAQIARLGLDARVTLAGAVGDGELAEHYAGADLFVLASRHEGYGMAFSEAIAHALPVVGTSGGATAETVPPDAGLLVAPDDVAALTAALRRVLDDRTMRTRLAAAARAAAGRLPRWDEQARLFADVIEAMA